MPPDAVTARNLRPSPLHQKHGSEEQARLLHQDQRKESEHVLKNIQAKKGEDALAGLQGGKADGKKGNGAQGPMDSEAAPFRPPDDKSDKAIIEAAEFAKKIAGGISKAKVPDRPEKTPEGQDAGKEATDGGMAADGGGGPGAATPPSGEIKTGEGGKPSAPTAPAGGGGGGGTGDSGQVKAELTGAAPTKYAEKIKTAGRDFTGAAKKEEAQAHKATPEFKAQMPGETKDAPARKSDKPKTDADIKKGGQGPDAKAPVLPKQEKVKGKKVNLGARMSAAKPETPPDALKSMFSAGLAKTSTKSAVNTDPGAAPGVELSGSSDPGRATDETAQADQKMAEAEAKFAKSIEDGPGPEQVQYQELDEKVELQAPEMPDISEIPVDPKMEEFLAKGHDKAVYDKSDELMAPEFKAHLKEADQKMDQALQEREQDREKAIAETEQKIADANTQAEKDQDDQIKQARKDIDEGRKKTKAKQEEELKKAQKKGSAAKQDAEKKIADRKKSDETKIKSQYADAKKRAAAEKRKAEQKAAEEKRKAEEKKKNQSWWERAASAIGSFLDKVASAIGDIFDKLSSLVGDILNAVKDAACAIIDAAVSFAARALDFLGDMLKKLVNGLLADIFPGLAKALNELIDKAVSMAKDMVKSIGETLKSAVSSFVDGLKAAVQGLINIYKTAITTALAVASAVVTGDWEKALKALLEGALNLAGIAPDTFYGFVGKSMDTIKKIVDDPGAFIGNLLKAVGKGFEQFAGNFWEHLKSGMVGWLTGQISETGLTLPKEWNAAGIFDLVLQIMGISGPMLKGKIEKKIGAENMALIEQVWGFVDAAIQGGLAGLWEHAKDQLGDLWGTVLDGIKGFLMEKIITAAVTKVASMFNPVGAIVQAVLTAWNVYKFVKEQAAKIFSLVQAVVDSMAAIVAGQIGGAANMVEGALARLVPIAISFLANLLGLGGIAKKVKDVIGKLQDKVSKAIDKVIDKMWELGKKALGALGGKGKKDEKGSGDKAEQEKKHREYAAAAATELSKPPGKNKSYEDARKETEALAKSLEATYNGKLESPIKMKITFRPPAEDKKDGDLDFHIKIAPNDTDLDGARQMENVADKFMDPHLEAMPEPAREYAIEKINASAATTKPMNWATAKKWLSSQDGIKEFLHDGYKVGQHNGKKAKLAALNALKERLKDDADRLPKVSDFRDKVYDRAKPRFHRGDDPYGTAKTSMLKHVFDAQHNPFDDAKAAYLEPKNPDVTFELAEIPKDLAGSIDRFDKLVAQYSKKEAIPGWPGIEGNPTSLRNTAEGNAKNAGKYPQFAAGFKTQIDKSIEWLSNIGNSASFPWLRGIEVRFPGGKLHCDFSTYETEAAYFADEKMLRELKNWTGLQGLLDSDKQADQDKAAEQLASLRKQVDAYAGQSGYRGVIITWKGPVPDDVRDIIDKASKAWSKKGKKVAIETF